MIRKQLMTVSTSRAQDRAFEALVVVSRIAHQEPGTRVIGGQMSSLLTSVFDVPGTIDRRTADADFGISIELAATGRIHERLSDEGFAPQNGNSYRRDGQQIDLLVPSYTGKFQSELHGGRAFDSSPGLHLALESAPIVVDLRVELTSGAHVNTDVQVPTVEAACVIKALATISRSEAKDIIDLYNLLSIAESYPPGQIGGWRLGEVNLIGSRKDAARTLHKLAKTALSNPVFRSSGVKHDDFTLLVDKTISSRIGSE